jgi:alkyl sulfatase BDS1-like metallo-beta-lactamase superfamily hydrolase
LPFEDTRDFEEAKRGFIAAPDYKQIMAEAEHVAWDIGIKRLYWSYVSEPMLTSMRRT